MDLTRSLEFSTNVTANSYSFSYIKCHGGLDKGEGCSCVKVIASDINKHTLLKIY